MAERREILKDNIVAGFFLPIGREVGEVVGTFIFSEASREYLRERINRWQAHVALLREVDEVIDTNATVQRQRRAKQLVQNLLLQHQLPMHEYDVLAVNNAADDLLASLKGYPDFVEQLDIDPDDKKTAIQLMEQREHELAIARDMQAHEARERVSLL